MTESWRNILVDRIGLQLNAYTWTATGRSNRFRSRAGFAS